jgi:hypothetical protein
MTFFEGHIIARQRRTSPTPAPARLARRGPASVPEDRGGSPWAGVAMRTVQTALNAPGHPLDSSTRTFMEGRFGHDFGRVRVHSDAEAGESARAVDALAYTVGQHVVFAANRYAPGTAEGRELLAHELTHVVQQDGGPGRGEAAAVPRITLGERHDAFEQEAGRIAEAVTRPGGGPSRSPCGPTLRSPAGVLRRQDARPPTEKELKAEAHLRRLATLPDEALTEWKRLNDAERSFVVQVMMGRYGLEFAQDFLQYATGKKKPNIVVNITNLPENQPKELAKRGFQHAFDNIWVHPSGESYRVYPPASKEKKTDDEESKEAAAKREKCQATCDDVDDKDACYKCCEDKIPETDSKCRTQCKVTCATKL